MTDCEARFRSYDPATAMYLGYDGLHHPCPLRTGILRKRGGIRLANSVGSTPGRGRAISIGFSRAGGLSVRPGATLR